jgi:hypothetical protein
VVELGLQLLFDIEQQAAVSKPVARNAAQSKSSMCSVEDRQLQRAGSCRRLVPLIAWGFSMLSTDDKYTVAGYRYMAKQSDSCRWLGLDGGPCGGRGGHGSHGSRRRLREKR